MERKIIKQGKGGYTIYLPKTWIEKKSLKAGDVINLIETETDLIVKSQQKEKKDTTIELSEKNKQDIKPILTHIYRRNFDKITIRNLDPHTLKIIKKTTTDLLLGFEITQCNDRYCTLENISEPAETKYDTLLRRIFLIVKETITIIREDFKNNKFVSGNEVNDLMLQQEKFILFCRRILTKEKEISNPILEWEMLTFLLHIEHALDYMHKYAKENKIHPDKQIIRLLQDLEEYFELYYNSYFKSDIKSIHKLNELKSKHHFGEIIDALEKSKGTNTVIYSYLRETFRLIQIGSSPILAKLLEKES